MNAVTIHRAIRSLRKGQKYRRVLAIACLAWGVAMVALGLSTVRSSGIRIGEIVGAFPDDPAFALSLVAFETTHQTTGQISILLGIVAIGFGIVRIVVPDPKSTVLLALIKDSELEQTDSNDDDA